RGRGTIVQRTPHEQSEGLRSAINDVDVDPEHLTIRILEQESDVARPPYGDLHGVFQAPYVRLFKLHIHEILPFCLMKIFVRQDIYKLFPPRAVEQYKVGRLVREAVPDDLDVVHQTITVEPANDQI